ncbi:MAG: winged helix-turn-helix domain-containing protein [Thermoanaerobaculia bacterium]
MPASGNVPPLRIGDFVADPGLDTLTGAGGESHLEPKIMEVLLVLARRRGETVSQEELLAEVWEGKFVVEAVVTRAVSELRKAFGDDPKAPRYIQTIARRGYRLIAPVEVWEAGGVEAAEKTASAEPVAAPPTSVAASAEPVGPESRQRSPRRELVLLGLLMVVAAFALWPKLRPAPGRSAAAAVPPEAFRLYSSAQQALAGGSCVAHQAIADLERALALAPTFAEAWEQYGWAQYNLVSSCGESGASYADAIRAAERALELAPGSTQALALKAAVLVETGRAEEAWALAAPRTVESPQIAFLAAYAATYGGALEAARTRIDAVASTDATFFAREGWTPNALLYLGDVDRFLALLPEASTPLVRFYRGYALWRGGRSSAALQELAPAFRERPSDPFARLAEGLVAVIEGRATDGRLLLGQLALQRTRLLATDGELTARIAELLAAAGDRELALTEVERAVAQGFFCSRCFESAPALGSIAGEERFRKALEHARQREQEFAALVAAPAVAL